MKRNFAGSGWAGLNRITNKANTGKMNTRAIKASLYISGFVFLSAIIFSCKTMQAPVDPKDLSYLYNPTKNPINPRYSIVNVSDELSQFAIKFFSTDLFFSEANPRGTPMAMMLVTVKLYDVSSGGASLADTAVLNLNILKETGRNEYVYNAGLKVQKGLSYVAEVKTLDKLRLTVIQAFVPFNTISDGNKYNFSARGHFEKNLLFNPVLRENEYVNLVYSRGPVDSIYISFFRPFLPAPDPPSMLLPEKTVDYEPDTMVALPYSSTMPMMFPKKGIYICSVSRENREGFTFFNFGKDFPNLTTPEGMIEPLAYIATQDELSSLRSAVKPKKDLDDFWIKLGGNVEKSRELIRIYYTRVLYSNYYFTSYKEGWKSERGMIYIMYGPPDKVYKSPDGESWGYRKAVIKSTWGGRVSLKDDYLFFNFKKKENLFTDNDFYLSRAETLVTQWDQAVISWRKGIVFRLDNPDDI